MSLLTDEEFELVKDTEGSRYVIIHGRRFQVVRWLRWATFDGERLEENKLWATAPLEMRNGSIVPRKTKAPPISEETGGAL